jgi:hypothetical protein
MIYQIKMLMNLNQISKLIFKVFFIQCFVENWLNNKNSNKRNPIEFFDDIYFFCTEEKKILNFRQNVEKSFQICQIV